MNERIDNTICNHPESNISIECHKNIIYPLDLTGGKNYLDETDRCVNIRTYEHANNLRKIFKLKIMRKVELHNIKKFLHIQISAMMPQNATLDLEVLQSSSLKCVEQNCTKIIRGLPH
jgi:hypothetical protein